MSRVGPDWSIIHQSKSQGIWFPLLYVLSILYGLGVWLRLFAYRWRIFRKRSLPGLVVSIGNLTAGGTGKTPAVAMLAEWAKNEGHRVAVISRGYRGRYKSKVLEVSDGNRMKVNSFDCGDEPYLLAEKVSGVPLVVSKQRYLAGMYAHEKFGSDFFILDDGFQHLALNRDMDILLMDSNNPFGNGHLLPWGPLREPIAQLARADAYLFTRANPDGPDDKALDLLKEKFPSIPVYYADHVPDRIIFPQKKTVQEPGTLKGKSVVAFAGIARNSAFRDTLVRLGADVVYFGGFNDHHLFKKDEIQTLIDIKERFGAQYLVTTEKDWVRIAPYSFSYPDMAYLCIEFVLLSGKANLYDMIRNAVQASRRQS